MTDETKACKESGRRLYDQLSTQVKLTGVGVGLAADGQHPAIHIYLRYKKDVPAVPTIFEGYEVKTHVTGVIRAL